MNKKLILALFLLCNNIQITKPGSQKITESLSSWLNASDQYSRWHQLGFIGVILFLARSIFLEYKEINKLNKKNNELSELNKNILDQDCEKALCFLLYLNNSQKESESLEFILGNHFKTRVDSLIEGKGTEKSFNLLQIFNQLNIKDCKKYADEITEDHLKSTQARFEFIKKKIEKKYVSNDFLKAHEEIILDTMNLEKSGIKTSVIYKKKLIK